MESPESNKHNKKNILGVPVDAVTLSGALDNIGDSIAGKKYIHIGVVNAAKIVNMHRNPELKEDVLASDMIFADGMAVVWASKVLGKALPERVTGIDLMYGLLERGNEKNYRVFCLGASEDVSIEVERQIKEKYPGVVVAGRRNGYFSDDEEESIAQSIADAHADILFVAITSPKKEKFMAKWNDLMSVKVVHGVGGSFDVMSGKVERAPDVWQKYGLEWLYRVKQEPRRLWKRYLVTNTLFLWLLLKYRLGFVR